MEEAIYRQIYEREDGHWWFRGRRAVIWSLLRRAGVRAPMRILDAGCGTGRNLREYGRLGPARGVDPSPDAVEFCRRRGLEDVAEAGVEALPFEDGAFDLVLACDVLEHVDDDRGALEELGRVAAPGARLLVTVPAYRWLWSPHDDAHHHRRRYTRPELLERMGAAGWTVTVATYFNSLLLPPIAVARAMTSRGWVNGGDYAMTPGWLDGALALAMRGEARAIERGARLPAGVSIGTVGVRR